MEELEEQIVQKNIVKTQHLSNKYLPKKELAPCHIQSKYHLAAVFGPEWQGKNSFLQPDPPSVYGDLVLDEDEKNALKLDPKFAIYQKIDEEEFECE